MSTYLTEEQQVELLKAWWKKNGNFAIGTLILAIIISLSLHFWFKHREVKLERGSAHYEQMLNGLVNGDDALTIKEASLLKDDYSHTPYSALASLIFARNDIYAEKYTEAESQLNWVMKHGNTSSLKQIARLSLARIDIQQNKPQDALKVLEKINDDNYLPMIDEVRGDSYLALNKTDQARAEYQKAADLLPNYAIARPILMMKLSDLAPANTSKNTETNRK